MEAGYVRIIGTQDELREARAIEGLSIQPTSAAEVGKGAWLVGAFATDGAVTELRSRGLDVEILQTSEQILAHIRSLDDYVEKDDKRRGTE